MIDHAESRSNVTAMTCWTSAIESRPKLGPRPLASPLVLSASSRSDDPFPARASRFALSPSATSVSSASRPSMLVTIRPTASADDDNGVAPRKLTERSCVSSADRSDRASAVVRTAADTASDA